MENTTPLFGARIAPMCKICSFNESAGENGINNKIFCVKKLKLVDAFHKCEFYVYCPLKRVPLQRNEFKKFTAEDFMI